MTNSANPAPWQLSATEVVRATHNGDLSASEVVQSNVDRMNEVNGDLNAIVEPLADQALARARELDNQRLAGEKPGPLHGVPVTIKINVDQKGHSTSNGIPALKDLIAPDDAPVVRNLLNAGAVVIGRTNTPEFSFRADTDNPLFGRTHNPWGRHVSAGGSSGGAGSAVMAGMGALAHGNDIGGSLRFPAAANGAVTVKPGLGRIPAWNPSQTAERGMLAQSMSVQGLLTRTAADLHLAMPAAISPDPRDPFHVPLPWRGAAFDGPLTVGFTKNTYGFDLHDDVSAALDNAAEALSNAGYIIEETEAPMLDEIGIAAYRVLMGEVQALMGPDIEAYGSSTLKDIFAEYFRQFPPYEGVELLQMMAKRSYYAREWSVFQQRYPLMLTPFLPQPFFVPERDAQGAAGVHEALGSALWSYSMNLLGLPAGSVPANLHTSDKGRQPVNVQIIGQRWREDLIVDAMVAVENHIGPMCTTLWANA
jgi:amidase